MPASTLDSLRPGVSRREVFAWAMYDFANSGYTTVVLTAVFNAYFVGVVAGKADWATLAWTLTLAASNLLTMLVTPALCAWADLHAQTKWLLGMVTVGCVAGTAGLALVGPGEVWLAVPFIIVSNFCFSAGVTVNSAFLPELAEPHALGKVSGWGWSLGYVGGLFTLGLCLAHVLRAQAAGAPAQEYVPVTMLITAGCFAAASLVTFALLHERAVPQALGSVGERVRASFARLFQTLRNLDRYRDFGWLCLCGLLYQAGLAVVVTLAAVYAEQVMHFTTAQTMAQVLVVNITAALGAFAFGYVQDRLGHRRADWTTATRLDRTRAHE